VGDAAGEGAMNEETGGATDPIVDAVVRASRALVGITVRALSSVSDEVTLPQLRTLVVVSQHGAQTVSALADRLDVHASTMTRMCSRLVSRGLVERLKALSVPIDGTRGYPKAEVTAGGVALHEVNFQDMQSRKTPGLFVAGEILDLDGPIGGYNFQAAWSTGHVAGLHV